MSFKKQILYVTGKNEKIPKSYCESDRVVGWKTSLIISKDATARRNEGVSGNVNTIVT
jgi:hypothetical protein